MTTMSDAELETLFGDPVAQKLLAASLPARLAYSGKDGSPRVVPIGWDWDGSHLLMWTTPNAPKVSALRRDPRVAVTIDTNDFPPKVLLVRGTAELEETDGVPQGYLDAGHKMVDDENYAEWEAGVTGLYDSMVEIRITPTWAKILDFETRIPSAVEELVREKQATG
ncbi:MAG TPA: pyridoxamine 5'-phosphate oxidase family protein [Lapillicoccus sp.]|jgi:nitroimidazol reductase NimA-like FMN-containing flavoprotein (pyridoxamine 5'-phosphate oxidase superfamily)|nr:pyridoxamine 5'-phosphate oxidase family protein [Lapillicoccus sp.]